ncbi:type IV toxin-antitoxin system AbiEi family antitoxin [Phyllobacterium zundukense]|uniref:Type IV toxin-antitoxin system AbiEi family antitoxin n=1 Tax=Phyllobacterium zundukense TaxID=1867719 RepID=A0ACD4CW08_9HYPH|nr:type IV toxin-antitoxin system AbiEi family antitoxin [Phyllobacterium zundukense]UXN57759.1 type IV toxin-antitoxin system AbiEi family antitoxin [Phyllobacterium zundukense]
MRQDPSMDRHAVDNLLKGRQLEPIAHGVYLRPSTRMNWESAVASLQNMFRLDLTPGGLTALEQQGFAHYLPISHRRQVHLFGKDPLPKWLITGLPDVEFVRHLPLPGLGATGLVNFEYETQERILSRPNIPGQRKSAWPFTLSSPERAYLEVLQDVPETISFKHAEQLLQGMTTLSPRVMERLLRKCTQVKVRRLFYWMAERHSYTWLKKLPPAETLDELGLGSGNRMLIKGGRLDAKYMITVPEDMWTPPAPITDKSGS